MNNPLVSIIITAYNTEKYLRPCLDSIVAQTYKEFEAILVDDGSKDQSGAICDEYAERDPHFVVVHKQNEGTAKARITGFEHSHGDLITFIDSDDYVSPEYLEKLSKPILEDDADMAVCWYYDVKASTNAVKPKKTTSGVFEGEEIKRFIKERFFLDRSLGRRRCGIPIGLWGKMIKREYMLQGLTDGVGLWLGQDQISLFSTLYRINKFVVIPDALYYYLHYEGQTTKRYNYSLWECLIELFNKYSQLDTRLLAEEGLRIRSFLFIRQTIFLKMIPLGVDKRTFVDHLKKMSEHPYMVNFFKPLWLGYGWKYEILYQLLRYHRFGLLYSLLKIKSK